LSYGKVQISQYGVQSFTLARECLAAPSEPLNVAKRYKEAATGQKMLRCYPTFSGL